MASLVLSQGQLTYQRVLISYKVILNRFQVQLDGFPNIPHGLINGVTFTDTPR